MATKLQTIEFKPGINKNNTPYSNENGWINCDKIRFREGKPRKMGGWVRQDQDTFLGVARDIMSWTNLDNIKKYLAIATNKKVYIYFGGTYYDVTPIRASGTPSNKLSTVNGSSQVKVELTGHNALLGDYVRLANSTPIGGITLSGEYTITEIVDVDNFKVNAGVNANATVNNAGGTLTYSLLLQNGLEFNQIANGWGSGTWGTGTWGTPRTNSSLLADLRQWSVSTWGEDLIANPRGGSIYVWDESNGLTVPLQQISGVPTQNNFTFVSYPTRHLVSLGCTSSSGVFDPLLVRWSTSENYTDWIPSATNTAGAQRMEHGNFLMGAEASKADILVFTDEAVYSMRYSGSPYVFGFDLLGQEAGLVSQHAAANVDGVVYWMSDNAIYRYDGSLRTLNCTVRDAIFDVNADTSLNKSQKQMVYAGVNQEFGEIIWLYPSKNSTKCDRYLIYNYLEDLWYDGTMDRSTWENPSIFDKPFATSNNGVLFVHEEGKNDDSMPMQSFITSGLFDIDNGDSILFVDRFIPDFEQVGMLQLEFSTKKYPQSPEVFTKTYNIQGNKGMINMRCRGRQGSIKISSNTTDGDFIIGRPRIGIQADGGR